MCWNPFPYWKSRSAKPRNLGGSLKAFQLEELLMLSAAPVPVDVIDPSLSADGGVVDVATVSSATSGEGTESILQAADVPQNESSASSDSVEDLLQQFGLNDTSDESQQNLELVFIDEATDNYQQLVDDLLDQGDDQTRIEIILLDSEEDGILQISEALEDYVNVDAVHIVSHGTEQSVKLGSTWLSLDNLDRFSESIAGWSDSFTPGTDLLFYGCQLAENDSGQELLRQIQELTGADIAASTDDTGAANLGGDWDLEFELGELETEVIFSSLLQNEWQGLLATETVLDQFSSQSYGNNDGTQNWNSNWVENDNSGGSQSASNGDVRITGGELRMVGDSGADNSVTREVDLSTAHDATLSFDATSSGTEAGDTFSVQISDDGGGSWTVLDVLEDYSGSYSKDISAYLAADTQIRIQIDSGYDGGLLGILFVEYLYIDNVQVSYTVNNPPDITSDGGGAAAVANVAENTTTVTTVTATDANLDTLNYAITGGADSGKFTINNSTGDLAFITAPDYESPTDNNSDNIYEVIVEASDGFGGTDSQTILVTVTPVNETPTAADNTVTTDEDTPYTFTAADFNFSDIDGDTLASVKITALETVGALQLSGADVTLNQVISRADIDAGNLTFTPVTNASGSSYDSFGFVVNDGALESSPSNTMTVDVTAVNDAPTASDNTVTTSEDTPYTFTAVDFNYSDVEGDSLASVKITALEIVGALQLSGADVTLNQVISRAEIDAGNLTFNPVANASGTSYDSFGFSVSDGALESTPPNTMTINVTAVNDPPTASDTTVITDEDTAYTFTAADFNFSDVDGDSLDSVRISSLPAIGMLQLSGVEVTQDQIISRAEIDAGNLTFVPLADGNGVAYDSFGFVVSDGSLEDTGANTMTIDVVPVNDAPVITSNGGGLNATVHVSGVLSTVATIEATDAESDVQVLTFSISGGLDADQFSIDASSGQLSFAAATELGGNSNDVYEVSVQVSDGVGGTATQLLTVIVDQGNQSFPSDQQTSDDTDSTSDSDQSDQNDSSSDSEGADHNSGTGNEDLIFSSLPADSDLFSQSQSRNAQANGVVLFASATPVDFSSLSQPLLDFTLETATDNVVTDYAYEAGGGQSTRTAVLRASIDPLRNSLEVHASEVVYTQLVWTRYDEIQEQVNLTAESDQLYISTAAVITTTVSSGLLIWALQGGYLMVGLASGLPTWRFMDPIAVLDEFGEDSDDEGDSLQSLIEQAESQTTNQSGTFDESEVV
ncbi:DUF4347 domain-containing protein [Gimesia panareensis]|uniref:DUF4347 domain-containing protein n=1 Tax=Gimesia panareensis TaxID=2527978 RepID=UPI00118A7583|nr:DUF4347 domain-containing protein [Gimesia panareensis]QDU51614.1 Cadherin domain protein [Gimesia panareensis]